MSSFLTRHWFLLALAVCLYLGFAHTRWILPIAELPGMRSGTVVVVLFLMGLALRTQAVVHSIRAPLAVLLALAVNVLALPGLAAIVAPWLAPEMGGGLIIAATVPCTLASASVWTRRGGGNDAVSMFVTIVTNLFCFLIAPTTLVLLLGRSGNIDFAQQAIKLVLQVLLPLIAAQLLQRITWVSAQLHQKKQTLSVLSQAGVLLMVLLGAAETADRMPGGVQTWGDIVAVGFAAISIHVIALLGGWWLAGRAGLPREDRVAVAIAGSQKTLMVGLQIAIDCGVSMLPMIIYHVSQLLIDTFFVQHPKIHQRNKVDAGQETMAATIPATINKCTGMNSKPSTMPIQA